MKSLVYTIFLKIVSSLSKEIGKELAQRFREKYKERILERLSIFFGKKKLVRKLMLIGAGEIGTEIGIVARERGWFVRAICFERNFPGPLDEKTPVPIRNLPFYRKERVNEKGNFYYTGETANETDPFQWTVLKKPKIDVLRDIILEEKPDIVLLEDMFLTPNDWKNLHTAVLGELKDKRRIFFVPSTREIEHRGKSYSDISMSKIKLREFLTEIGLKDYLLGKKDEYINISNFLKELVSGEYRNEVEKIKKALQDYGKIILKFDTVSSGHGQFILSDVSFLNPRLIKDSLKYTRHRVPNDHYVFEKYLDTKKEVCAIVARTKGKKTGLNRIYYQKYDLEKIIATRFKWVSRLVFSESKTGGDVDLWIRLGNLIERISQKLNVPYLYIEFLLDMKQKSEPKIFINEISYRPDDAGFVSFLSHAKDQFRLFVESLENLLEAEKLRNTKAKVKYIKPRGKFVCETICPGKVVEFLPDNLTWPIQTSARKTNFKLSLYEKFLKEKNGEIDYGRIIGFLWHSKDKKGKELLSDFKFSLGLDEETYKIIFDALSEAERVEENG